MEYLLKSSAIVALFLICYYLFLQRDTFFESNRWFLLLGLITAFCIPFVTIPIYIEQISTPVQDFVFAESSGTGPVKSSFDILQLFSGIYIMGVLFFFIRFAFHFYSLSRVLLKNKKHKYKRYTLVETHDDLAPFSFFNWIVYNPNHFKVNELKQIITHEKVHVYQLHSIDIFCSQLTSIILWFNPFIWMYRKTLQQNLEFIADKNVQNKIECKKSYQYLLLKTSVPHHQLALTNNFYNSLIKKRIVMLHKKRSKISNHWKFTLILPLLALFLWSFNVKEIVIENEDLSEVSYADVNVNSSHETHDIIITKDHTEADLIKIKEKFAKEGITVKFKGVKRNDAGEITAIKINVSSENSKANYNMDSDDPIEAIVISLDSENNSISIGNPSNIHFGKGYSFVTSDKHHKIHKKGSNVMFFSSDEEYEHEKEHEEEHEHEEVIIIKEIGKVHELKKGIKVKDIHVISGDDHKLIEIDEDVDYKVIIKKDLNIIKEMIHDEDVNIKVHGKAIKIKTIGKGKGEKVFFMNSDGEEHLFVLDGKVVSKSVIDNLDSDTIETIEVLKGDSATDKYGDKAKDGVVQITTKKKKE